MDILDKNNKLIKIYSDDTRYVVGNISKKSTKLINPNNQQINNNYYNRCIEYTGNTNLILNSCNSSNGRKFILTNSKLSPTLDKNKCITSSNNNISIVDCDVSDDLQRWAPDSNNRIHSLTNYDKCLDTNNNSILIGSCNDNNSQTWSII